MNRRQMQIWGLPDPKPDANCAPHLLDRTSNQPPSGRSSGVEHNLAKVGVEGSNPFARSKSLDSNKDLNYNRNFYLFGPV